jgi:hypothetical protein
MCGHGPFTFSYNIQARETARKTKAFKKYIISGSISLPNILYYGGVGLASEHFLVTSVQTLSSGEPMYTANP